MKIRSFSILAVIILGAMAMISKPESAHAIDQQVRQYCDSMLDIYDAFCEAHTDDDNGHDRCVGDTYIECLLRIR